MNRPARRRAMRSLSAALIAAALCTVGPASAESPVECAPTDDLDKHRLLRQLSLDLFGRIPTVDEYAALDDADGVTAEVLDDMLSADEYFAQVREYHRSLIWGGLQDETAAVGNNRRLAPRDGLWRIGNQRRTYRGRVDVECLDQRQTQFDADGHPVPIETFSDPQCRNGTCVREGYVRVSPYWAPDTTIKVCAFDAQALAADHGGPACGPYTLRAGCGCGAGLRYCLPPLGNPVHELVKRSLAEEATRIFESVVKNGQSYFDAFTTPTTFVNGPLSHFYRHLTRAPLQQNGAVGFATRTGDVPALPFGDTDTWVPVERGTRHSGVLTTGGFHLRFASNRSRVNRFYTAFRCEPFVPSAGGLPPETEELPNPNLRERPGCDACHATIEVAAAHWGRWRTGGEYGYLGPSDVEFDRKRNQCMDCDGVNKDCSAFCNRYFVTRQNATHPEELDEWEGYPSARAWLSEDEANLAAVGPSALVDDDDERARIATCTSRTLAERMLGRELTEPELLAWLPELTATFADSGYDFTALVRAVVTSPVYRTLR